ncbi:MAG: LysR family transcriptional regulator [Nannocystaceae bacterium]
MSLVQLESFVAVAEEGHLGRAAQRLHISQPPLTRRIQSLEVELGVPLFERTPRGMRLLPAGHTLVAHAKAIARQVDNARESVRRAGLSAASASNSTSASNSASASCSASAALSDPRRSP